MIKYGVSNKAAFYDALAGGYPRASILNESCGRKFFDQMIRTATNELFQDRLDVIINCELEAAEYVIDSGFTDDLEAALEIVYGFEELPPRKLEYGLKA